MNSFVTEQNIRVELNVQKRNEKHYKLIGDPD